MWNHNVLRTSHGLSLFSDPLIAEESWRFLSEPRGDIASLILMPNHTHLISKSIDAQDLLLSLRQRINRKFGFGVRNWDGITKSETIADVVKLRRSIRYVHLNPARAGLTRDPLLWRWSTHRDWLGYVSQPIVSADAIHAMGFLKTREKFHHYVSADPSVDVAGTLLPKAPEVLALSLDRLKSVLQTYYRCSLVELAEPRHPLKAKAVPLVIQTLELKEEIAAKLFQVSTRQIRNLSHLPVSEIIKQRFKEMVGDLRF
ncbi:MAG: hypothetical protein KA715_13485 [Xanthomonadaceae bacterium]|nr:hypothetical protein [Xanthomonadaceae bacterium]